MSPRLELIHFSSNDDILELIGRGVEVKVVDYLLETVPDSWGLASKEDL